MFTTEEDEIRDEELDEEEESETLDAEKKTVEKKKQQRIFEDVADIDYEEFRAEIGDEGAVVIKDGGAVKINGGSVTSTVPGTPGILFKGEDEVESCNANINNVKFTVTGAEVLLVRNIEARIYLSGSQFLSQNRDFAVLRAELGGVANLNLVGQVLEGDITADSASSVELTLSSSYYMGAINSADSAGKVILNLDASSNVILAGDSYVSELVNIDTENQNIYSNGYKLYVDGVEVAVNGSEVLPEVPEAKEEQKEPEAETIEETETEEITTDGKSETPNILFFILGGIVVALAIVVPITLILRRKK